MNINSENEIISEEEINLYDYWKVLVKRKKILIGIFLAPLIILIILISGLPRYYKGESEINYRALLASPASPASPISSVSTASNISTVTNIVKLVGDIDDTKKVKIFAKNSDIIKSVSISIPKKSTDKINIIIEAKTTDSITQAFIDLFEYISNLPEVKEEIARFKEETDLKIKKLIEAKKANHVFLNQITDMMKKRQLSVININPAEIVEKDVNLSLEIMNLQKAKEEFGKLVPLMLPTKHPSNSQIKQRIIITGLLSLFAAILVVFFLEYIERMNARENKSIQKDTRC
jgi:hypothetical protein